MQISLKELHKFKGTLGSKYSENKAVLFTFGY